MDLCFGKSLQKSRTVCSPKFELGGGVVQRRVPRRSENKSKPKKKLMRMWFWWVPIFRRNNPMVTAEQQLLLLHAPSLTTGSQLKPQLCSPTLHATLCSIRQFFSSDTLSSVPFQFHRDSSCFGSAEPFCTPPPHPNANFFFFWVKINHVNTVM